MNSRRKDAINANMFTYTIGSNGAVITGLPNRIGGTLSIPAVIEGYPVIAISDDLLQKASGFPDFRRLTSVTIPSTVISIGKEVLLRVFCHANIVVAPDNPVYSSENGVLFDKIRTTLLRFPAEKTAAYEIPAGVTKIGDHAFYQCTLTSITIPDGVEHIGEGAFSGCRALSSITIPDSVEYIGDFAFEMCESLTNIALPDSVTHIGECTFRGCASLTNLPMANGITSLDVHSFDVCQGLTDITIPASVTDIKGGAFSLCSNLRHIAVNPQNPSYTSEDGVFFSKDKSTLLCCPAGKKVGIYEIPSHVTVIGSYAFDSCKKLTHIIVPDGVKHIGKFAFNDCKSLTSLTIPDGVEHIGVGAFWGCESLASLTIPDGVKHIESNTFHDCKSLTSLTIPDGAEHIETFAFWGCESLTSLTIPTTVKRIGMRALSNCSALTDIYYGGDETAWKRIEIDSSGNEALTHPTIHYNYTKR